MFAKDKGAMEVGAVEPTTLAVLDLRTTITFEALSTCTSDYGRPARSLLAAIRVGAKGVTDACTGRMA